MFTLKNRALIEDKRLLTETEAAGYTGIGRTTFRAWAAEIGARRTFGRAVRYDKHVIDKAIEEMASAEEG